MSQINKVLSVSGGGEEGHGGDNRIKVIWTPQTRAERIRELIKAILHLMDSQGPKATVGDLIRLIQVEDEFLGHQPKDVTVQWVEPERG